MSDGTSIDEAARIPTTMQLFCSSVYILPILRLADVKCRLYYKQKGKRETTTGELLCTIVLKR
jgi:hypothetical protein